jgi:hypothetical protein
MNGTADGRRYPPMMVLRKSKTPKAHQHAFGDQVIDRVEFGIGVHRRFPERRLIDSSAESELRHGGSELAA